MRKKIYSNLVIILFCLLNLSGCGTKKKVNVKVPGGDLRIEIEGNSIYMIGDASFICDGRAY